MHRAFLPSELISRVSSGMPKCPLEWHIFLLKHHFTIHAPCALRSLDKNNLMTDISSGCEASGYACFRAEMLPIVLLSASQEDSLEPGTRKTIWRGPCREEGEGAQCHLCYIYLLFQSLKQIKGSIKYHPPLASSGAWREECLEWELAIFTSPPTLEKLSGWRSLSRITPYRLSGCTKRNEMAEVQKWILQEDCKAPATVSPTSTVPDVVYQGPQDVARRHGLWHLQKSAALTETAWGPHSLSLLAPYILLPWLVQLTEKWGGVTFR